ncbi:DUF4345 domain-containing protein [Woodsholea maritima]|uniref:DUF4345 domain-containing protein n=1 Tax=Woodsholea maritima TaxID=240237 RepID=UPI000372AED0|nr:DUF4345 domain-containing protein [Woodsholea maritima]
MKQPWVLIAIIALSLILLAFGIIITFNPHTLYAGNHVTLSHDPNILSEIRAPGGLILLSGMFLALSVFIPRLRTLALTTASLLYFGYGMGRVVSIILDGPPSVVLISAMAAEFILAVISISVLIARRPKRTHAL